MSTPRRAARFLVAVVTVLGALLALAFPADAHGGAGTMGIEVTPGTAPFTAQVRVLLEYANDREVVPGATVVAAATGPDGATVGPTPLTDQGQGRYEAVLTLPAAGVWTVTVTAAEPAATASAAVTVSGAPTTTTAPADDVRTSPDRATRDATRSDDGGGPGSAVLAAIAIALVAAAGVAFMLTRRR